MSQLQLQVKNMTKLMFYASQNKYVTSMMIFPANLC